MTKTNISMAVKSSAWCFVWMMLVIFGIKSVHGQNIECHSMEECKDDSLVDTNVNATIQCWGYRSCEQAALIQGEYIQCYGGYSCYKAENINSTAVDYSLTSNENFGGIRCSGLASCAKAEMISGIYIHCGGEQSCANSQIKSSNLLECEGDQSCANSQITASSVYLLANLAGANSIFYDNSTIGYAYYRFFGPESGFNSTVLCGIGHVCTVTCYTNGCKNLTLKCINGGVDSCTFTINCDYAEYDEINCPNGYRYEDDHDPQLVLTPSLLNVTMSTIENSINLCNKTWKLCGDSNNCVHDQFVEDDPFGVVCCVGTQSCNAGQSHITATIFDSGNRGMNVAIRCDGYRSCHSAGTNTSSIYDGVISSTDPITVNNSNRTNVNGTAGNIYATGVGSTYTLAWARTVIKTSSNYDIFCTAEAACGGQHITNGRNLYCTATQSCGHAISNLDTVYAFGYASVGSRIENISGNIYCGGYQSCIGAEITNVNGIIFGTNRGSLFGASIVNVGSVYCFGPTSCNNVKISGIATKLVAVGDDALSGVNITTNAFQFNSGHVEEDETFVVHIIINGTNLSPFSIYCSEGDICCIECQSEYSCAGLNISCQGGDSQCIVSEYGTNLSYCPQIASTTSAIATTSTTTSTTTMIATIETSDVFNNNKKDKEDIITIVTGIVGGILLVCLIGWIWYTYSKSQQTREAQLAQAQAQSQKSDGDSMYINNGPATNGILFTEDGARPAGENQNQRS